MFSAFAVALLMVVPPAAAQQARQEIPEEYRIPRGPDLPPAPFKSLPPGTRMVWQDQLTGKREQGVVREPDGLILRWTWEGRPQASVGHLCEPCAEVSPFSDWGESAFAKMYPLEVGKTLRFERRIGERRLRDEIAVIATDRLTIPLGTFDTYVIRHRSESVDGSWRAERRAWYAPALGWIVKFVSGDNRGREASWEMIALN